MGLKLYPYRKAFFKTYADCVVRYGLGLLGAFYKKKPVPVPIYRRLMKWARSRTVPEPNLLHLNSPITDNSPIANAELRELLAGARLGDAALAAASINFLEAELKRLRPKMIIEFGSGISTLCLAFFMKRHLGAKDLCVVSIEQDKKFQARSLSLLKDAGFGELAQVLHFPLADQVIEGVQSACYSIDHSRLSEVMGSRRADFLLIDGPIGGGMRRFGPLPLVRRWAASGAAFYLDDGLRWSECEVAHAWTSLDYLQVLGIWNVGKGLITGRFD